MPGLLHPLVVGGLIVILLLYRRFAMFLHLGVEVCLLGKNINSMTYKRQSGLTPSTNETKLKNGTHSCTNVNGTSDASRQSRDPKHSYKPPARGISEQIA